MKYFIIVFLFISGTSFSQPFGIFKIDSVPTSNVLLTGVLLDKNWKFHVGDNPDFAKPEFDDSAWENIDPTKDIHD